MAGKGMHFKAKTNFLQGGMAPISMHLSGNSFPFNNLFMVNVSRQWYWLRNRTFKQNDPRLRMVHILVKYFSLSLFQCGEKKTHKALLKLSDPQRDSCLCCSADRPKRCKTFRGKSFFSCGIVPLLGCGALMSWINACHASTVQNPSPSRMGWTILTPILLPPPPPLLLFSHHHWKN